MRKIHTNIIY